jgi:threonine/homoserine/homoserine lactone efflux protein
MPIETWLAFVAAAAVLLILPGPTILTVISYSVAHGGRARLPVVAGVSLGDSTALALSLLGLGALLARAAFWFTVVKWLGGLYLVYLGVRLLLAGAAPADAPAPAPCSGWRLFANTWLVTALNPKGIIFFVAFLPQFIHHGGASVNLQLLVLAGTFVAMATLNATLYSMFADAARRVLASPRAQRRFHLAGGTLLCGAGVWALLARRPA